MPTASRRSATAASAGSTRRIRSSAAGPRGCWPGPPPRHRRRRDAAGNRAVRRIAQILSVLLALPWLAPVLAATWGSGTLESDAAMDLLDEVTAGTTARPIVTALTNVVNAWFSIEDD